MAVPGFPDRQTPAAGEVFLDHVGWYVADMDAARAAFERLGFILTPFTRHTHESADGDRVASGTANCCAMLELGYLEILTHVAEIDTALARQLRAGLGRYTGLHLIAFSCADAEVERQRIAAAGFEPLPVAHLRRPIYIEDSGERNVAFSVIRLPPDAMAEGRIQMLSQDTPEIAWQPSLIARDNAIDALTGVVVCTTDPGEAAGRFARLVGRGARTVPDGMELALERGRVRLVTHAGLARLLPGVRIAADPFIAAVTMRSRDLAATSAFLTARGVAVADLGGALAIDAGEAMGAYAIVHGHDAAWPP